MHADVSGADTRLRARGAASGAARLLHEDDWCTWICEELSCVLLVQ